MQPWVQFEERDLYKDDLEKGEIQAISSTSQDGDFLKLMQEGHNVTIKFIEIRDFLRIPLPLQVEAVCNSDHTDLRALPSKACS